MPNPRYQKGKYLELWLVKQLQKHGIFAMRSPASRQFMKGNYLYVDVIAIYKGNIFLFECIRRKDLRSLRIKASTICRLLRSADVTNGEPFLCIKVDSEHEVRFIHAGLLAEACYDECHIKNTTVVIGERLFKIGLTIDGIIKLIKDVKKILR